jgi:hypothetical protein
MVVNKSNHTYIYIHLGNIRRPQPSKREHVREEKAQQRWTPHNNNNDNNNNKVQTNNNKYYDDGGGGYDDNYSQGPRSYVSNNLSWGTYVTYFELILNLYK